MTDVEAARRDETKNAPPETGSAFFECVSCRKLARRALTRVDALELRRSSVTREASILPAPTIASTTAWRNCHEQRGTCAGSGEGRSCRFSRPEIDRPPRAYPVVHVSSVIADEAHATAFEPLAWLEMEFEDGGARLLVLFNDVIHRNTSLFEEVYRGTPVVSLGEMLLISPKRRAIIILIMGLLFYSLIFSPFVISLLL